MHMQPQAYLIAKNTFITGTVVSDIPSYVFNPMVIMRMTSPGHFIVNKFVAEVAVPVTYMLISEMTQKMLVSRIVLQTAMVRFLCVAKALETS